MNYGKHGCRTPDTPFSLFEGKRTASPPPCDSSVFQRLLHFLTSVFTGMAGTIYFLADLLQPMSAKFPAFEV